MGQRPSTDGTFDLLLDLPGSVLARVMELAGWPPAARQSCRTLRLLHDQHVHSLEVEFPDPKSKCSSRMNADVARLVRATTRTRCADALCAPPTACRCRRSRGVPRVPGRVGVPTWLLLLGSHQLLPLLWQWLPLACPTHTPPPPRPPFHDWAAEKAACRAGREAAAGPRRGPLIIDGHRTSPPPWQPTAGLLRFVPRQGAAIPLGLPPPGGSGDAERL